jgi:hypothetical protein
MYDPQTFNRYAYTRNNPLAYVDPDGRDLEKAWHGLKAFLNSIQVKYSIGFGAKAGYQLGVGEVKVGASNMLNLKAGGDVALQLTQAVEYKAGTETSGGKTSGLTIKAEQPLVTLNPDATVTLGGPPSGTISGKTGADIGDASLDVSSKEEVGVGVEGGLGLVAGAKVTTTFEGISGAAEFVTETADTLKNAIIPVPRPPKPSPPRPPKQHSPEICRDGQVPPCPNN